MKKTFLALGTIAFIALGAVVACNADKKPSDKNEGLTVAAATKPSAEEMVARGRYLVTIMGCNDCHTPKIMTAQGPAPDTSRLLSGHPAQLPVPVPNQEALKSWVLFSPTLTAYAGPWGISYAANLSSDASGIGNWSEEQFFRALREGKYKGLENGRPLLPPMPWQQFAQATDEDLRAIFTYLKSTQPIENVVPAAKPPVAAK